MLDALIKNGYVEILSDPNISTLEMAKSIGNVLKIPTMPLTQTLTPRLKENEHESTYSGNFGIEEFPFHTDLAHWYIPPRFFLLRCIIPAPDVHTKLIDSNKIYDCFGAIPFSKSHFKPRKKLDRTANILKIKEGDVFRWDSIFIQPANKSAEELSLLIKDKINRTTCIEISLDKEGKCVLIDNWRMLHARDPISRESMSRKIERIYFEEVML